MTIVEMLNGAALILGMLVLLVMATLPLFTDGGGSPGESRVLGGADVFRPATAPARRAA